MVKTISLPDFKKIVDDTTLSDIEKYDKLYDNISDILLKNHKNALPYIDVYFDYVNIQKIDKYMGLAYMKYGIFHFYDANYDKALQYYILADKYMSREVEWSYKIAPKVNIAMVYRRTGQERKALTIYKEALEDIDENNIKVEHCQVHISCVDPYITIKEYDAAENAVSDIKADMALLEAQIAKTELRAPFSGRLGLRNVSLGAYISPNTIITSLQNLSQLKMDVTVPEKYASSIRIGDNMNCKVAGVDKPFNARVIAIEPNIDETTRNLKIRALIQNPTTSLIPGAYVKVDIQLKEIPNAIMIPSNAVIPDDRTTRIVVTDSSKAKFIPVEIGVRTDKEVQVLSGLHAGDTVLVSGLLQVKPGMPVKITKTSTRVIAH
ncbi:MAG TPA: efflux RND transporter periplasmic adaptor subunit [Chitinophagales bacterium]|nr:efflux RND transporter periplasmic adaptor subunit [Chitinophagales bacterium]